MERGRLASINAPGRVFAVGCVVGLAVLFVVGVVFGDSRAAGGTTSEPATGSVFDPGGPGPSAVEPAGDTEESRELGESGEPGESGELGDAPETTATEAVSALDATACDGSTTLADRVGPQRNRFIVTVAYCTILRRPPDDGGLRYWTGQMEDGLTAFELIEVLIGSAEYQARQTRAFNDSLNALTLGPARAAEIRERELQAAIEADAERQAEVVRQSQEQRAALLRVRTPVSGDAFLAHIGGANLATTDTITEALIHGTLPGDRQPVNVAYVHLSQTEGVRVSPGGRRQATVGTWAAEIGAHVAVNGNWYSPFDGPAVSNGAVYGGSDHFYTSLFGFTEDGDAIIEHHRAVNDAVDERIVEGVSGHPTLIYRGERTTDFGGDPTFTTRQPRTAIGLDVTGDILILVTVDGRSSVARGMTGDETAQLMEQLGAHDAVMLDGGGSSTMWIANRGIVNNPSGALRAVGNQIAVFGE